MFFNSVQNCILVIKKSDSHYQLSAFVRGSNRSRCGGLKSSSCCTLDSHPLPGILKQCRLMIIYFFSFQYFSFQYCFVLSQISHFLLLNLLTHSTRLSLIYPSSHSVVLQLSMFPFFLLILGLVAFITHYNNLNILTRSQCQCFKNSFQFLSHDFCDGEVQ